MSLVEELLEALLNGSSSDIVPQSRVEACLKNCLEDLGTEGLPPPISRLEVYLHALAEKIASGSSSGGGGDGDGDDSIKWLFKNEIFPGGPRTDLPAFDPTTHDAYVFINGGDYVYKLVSTDLGIGYTSDSVGNDSPFIVFVVTAIEGYVPANSWVGGNVYGGDAVTLSVFLVEKQ